MSMYLHRFSTKAPLRPGGITLKEFPGRVFQFSSVGMSAADMSARALGENNRLTRPEVAAQIEQNRQAMKGWLEDTVKVGSRARLTTPKGAVDAAEQIRAVVEVDGTNINRELIDRYGQYRVPPSCRNPKASRTRARGPSCRRVRPWRTLPSAAS